MQQTAVKLLDILQPRPSGQQIFLVCTRDEAVFVIRLLLWIYIDPVVILFSLR